MPKSKTKHLDYYPPGWIEEIHGEYYIEWTYEKDPTITVRLDGSMCDSGYTVTSVTGVNDRGEEFITKNISQLSREDAFEVASVLIYAINGAVERINSVK